MKSIVAQTYPSYCVAISDPKAMVDIDDVSSMDTVKSCVRVGGVRWSEWHPSKENPTDDESAPQPWECTITATIKTDDDFNISCVASWQGQVHRSREFYHISPTTTDSTVTFTYGVDGATPAKPAAQSVAPHDICRVWMAVLSFTVAYMIK